MDRADLLQVKDRFFTADNATIAIIGNVNRDFVYRATRRLFGGWKKSEQKVPATFRLPATPDTKEVSIEMPDADRFASRMGMIVPARNDKDFYAAQILTRIWQEQFCLNSETYFGKSDYQPYLLRGFYTVSKNVVYGKEELPISSGRCRVLLTTNGKTVYPPITQDDFERVKKAVLFDYQQKPMSSIADLWLDVDTYRLVSVKDEMSKLNNVSFADVQRVAEKLQNEPRVSVTVKKPEAAKQ
jgi:predicted Zn-dependent peptidase